MSLTRMIWTRVFSTAICLLLLPVLAAAADKPNGAQKRAVSEFLDAVASGSPQAVAFAIHPSELENLRLRVLTQLRDEAAKGDSTIRVRLFGRARSLAELERLTSIDFYVALAPKLYLFGRSYRDADWLAAIPDKDGVVQVVLRGEQEKERGRERVDVVNVVSIRPYGKDWKAIVPTEIEAQIDDIIHARRNIYARLPPPALAPPSGPASGSADTGIPPAITTLLEEAGNALAVPNCEDYYLKYMSPNFRKVTSKKALDALIHSCKTSLGTRELLVATIRIVKDLVPTFEFEGRRAVYDVSGQGLPFDRFVIEQVDRKWYIAE
jgi:hypothetical protein